MDAQRTRKTMAMSGSRLHRAVEEFRRAAHEVATSAYRRHVERPTVIPVIVLCGSPTTVGTDLAARRPNDAAAYRLAERDICTLLNAAPRLVARVARGAVVARELALRGATVEARPRRQNSRSHAATSVCGAGPKTSGRRSC